MKVTHRMIGKVCTVSVVGEILDQDVPELQSYVMTLLDNQAPNAFVMNLEETSHVDSAGIGFILMLYRTFARIQIKFVLCQLGEQVSTIFDMTQLSRVTTIYATEEEALVSI
ncbi:MAG: STAS domain-containing protein [SAR324 cluster bacterium]|nr:STAS domain-containing protein [SAR324 cluster bacterium]